MSQFPCMAAGCNNTFERNGFSVPLYCDKCKKDRYGGLSAYDAETVFVAAPESSSGVKAVDPKQSQIEKDPNGIDQHSPGAKLDAGKIRPYLILNGFKRALHEVYANGTFGANKYSDNGWMQVPNAKIRYMDAAFRHFDKYERQEDPNNRDPESKTHHLGAMAWNILAVLELELKQLEENDIDIGKED